MGEDYIEGDYEDAIDTDTTFDPVEFDWSSLPTDEDVTNVMVEDQYQNWEDFLEYFVNKH